MSKMSRTWWGQKFIEAVEEVTDAGRLSRGRSYAKNGKILDFEIEIKKSTITAIVRGSINPYFGVYKEPRYHTEITFKPIAKQDWAKIIKNLSTNASFVSKLLLNEVPDNIEKSFLAVNQNLLPHSHKDFSSDCSCPDWSNPCKHIAGVFYLFATHLDRDPFLLFELRGLSKEDLKTELAKTPLGQALISGLGSENLQLNPVPSYYTVPQTQPLNSSTNLKDFWLGEHRLPEPQTPAMSGNISGVVVKKQGDYPPFWHCDRSFLETMDELYNRVKTKHKGVF